MRCFHDLPPVFGGGQDGAEDAWFFCPGRTNELVPLRRAAGPGRVVGPATHNPAGLLAIERPVCQLAGHAWTQSIRQISGERASRCEARRGCVCEILEARM